MVVNDAQQSATLRDIRTFAALRSRIQLAALLLAITAGCSLDNVTEVELRDAAAASDSAADERPKDRSAPDGGGERDSRDAPGNPVSDSGAPNVVEWASDAATAAEAPTVDADASMVEAAPEVVASPSEGEVPPVSRCSSGSYEGGFTSIPMGLLPPEMIAGRVTLDLTPITGQDRLALAGRLDGAIEGGLMPGSTPVSATIRAVLNCGTHQLEGGELLDSAGLVAGALEGVYSDNPRSLSGVWRTGGALLGFSGSWSAAPKAP